MFKIRIHVTGFFLLASFTLNSWPEILKEKVENAITSTFEVETFLLEEITVNDELKNKVPSEINNNNLFKLKSNNTLIGYAYVGKAPSMKKEFDYIILFDKDLIIKKSKVLIYREMHGQQIGSQRWLKQFIDKSKNDTLEIGKDISGISGATISTSSMTKATNNVLRTVNILFESDIL